ncbi:MAG: SPOR domain-containing protein [Bacteroidales bacterium]|nr:SPOR domain-containing protein [Bacteroidales bacterium]
MLDDYIKELIASNNRVIIPNFGAFLLRATSKNKNKKELSEKIEDIYFSPFLKFNDELLVNHIVQKEGDDQSGAMDKINQYIKTIEQQVKEEGSYTIEKLGDFYMDDQGKVQFKVHGNARRETPAGKKEPGESEESPSAKTINEKAAEGKKTSSGDQGEKKEPAGKPEPATPKADSAKSGKSTTQPGTGASKGKKSHTPPPPPKDKSKKTKERSDSGTNRGLILSVAIGVPIAVIFIWAMLNFDTVQDLFRKDSQQIDTPQQTEAPSENSSMDKAGSESPSETQSETSTGSSKRSSGEPSESPKAADRQSGSQQQTAGQQQTLTAGKKYYLVAGSFQKKENAVNFREKLMDQGYNAEMVGERNGMHAVSYASFQNKSKAQSELRRLREEEGLTAWLLYH